MRNVIGIGLGVLTTLLVIGELPAQVDSVARPAVHDFRWYHAVGAVGALAGLSLIDRPLRDDLQDHRTSGKDDLARIVRRVGQPEIYGTVALGTLAVGLISGDARVTKAGERITASLGGAGLTVSILKRVVGRSRPNVSARAYAFHPFTSADAWPSGHTTMAFALAASVSDEVGSLPVSIGMYSAATLTAWSRLNDNKHWLTDVLSGALVGVASAKFVNGHWRVFGIHGPRMLLGPDMVGARLEF